MDKLAGYIRKEGINYSVIDDSGIPIKIDHVKFPSVKDIGVAQMALFVSYYVAMGKFVENTDEKIQKEIKLAIGDKG